MKGIVFTEFLDMVESAYSADLVDDIIEDADLESGGVYTAVATYPHQEMVALVTALCQRTGLGMPDALKGFGHYLFGRFHALYPQFFQPPCDETLSMIPQDVQAFANNKNKNPLLLPGWASNDSLPKKLLRPRKDQE